MAATVASSEARVKDPDLPVMHRLGDIIAPKAPTELAHVKLEERTLADMLVKLAYTVPRFTTEWAVEQLHLSQGLVERLLEKVTFEGLIEQLWQTSQASSHYKITQQGREHAGRLLELCGYVGPCPVRLEAYTAMLRFQFATMPQVQP